MNTLKHLLAATTAAGVAVLTSAEAKAAAASTPQPSITQRIDAVRAKMEALTISLRSEAPDTERKPSSFLQWVNWWTNWGNWDNWRNWANAWSNFWLNC